MDSTCVIVIQNSENEFEIGENYYNESTKLKQILTAEQWNMVESYYEPVFYCTNDGDGDDIEDEEGYETGKLFSLDSLVDDIAACSNESKIELTVGYKVQVTIHEPAAGNYVGKIAASSGTRLIELLESFDNDPTAYIATINGEEVDKSSVLGSLANGNQKVEVTISK